MDLRPASVRVKELQTIMNELQSELKVKTKDNDTLRSVNKAIVDGYVQLKRKYEDDSIVLSQPLELDSLECDPEVSIITIGKY